MFTCPRFYPAPCYLMYNPHIKSMNDPEKFAKDVILPRLRSTVSYREYDEDYMITLL